MDEFSQNSLSLEKKKEVCRGLVWRRFLNGGELEAGVQADQQQPYSHVLTSSLCENMTQRSQRQF